MKHFTMAALAFSWVLLWPFGASVEAFLKIRCLLIAGSWPVRLKAAISRAADGLAEEHAERRLRFQLVPRASKISAC